MTPFSETVTQLLRRRAGERAFAGHLFVEMVKREHPDAIVVGSKEFNEAMGKAEKGQIIIIDDAGKEFEEELNRDAYECDKEDWWKR